ncbi:proton-conducting transporter membrane subunit [Aestuariibacter salexigens]|uniref:proton-conducting transporter transmembrane domain-containing protein n=1 Tax=Aestuariibacter salexigens TaxID=226010 RepID=UPI0003FE10C7|nr:proton-conducting transporter membrane subunit [Aestuariibacter salexigens]
MSMTMLIAISMLLPLAGAIVVSRLDRVPNIREAATLVTAVILFIVNILIFGQFTDSDAKLIVAEPMPNLTIAFSVEHFGMLFALIASSLWIVTSIYAIGYMRGHHEKNQTRFYTFFAVAISAVMGVAYADNLFTLFLFYEILTVTTYPLVTHAGNDKARKGGRTYLGILMGSSIAFFLPALVIVWYVAGDTTFASGGMLAGKLDPKWAAPLLLLFIFGIGKAAVMPLHRWLPAAMVAPTPVSALLHAVAVVKAGVFSMVKVVGFVFGTDFLTQSGATHWLIWLPMLTILLGSLVAMTRDNLKERLAYSTISQLSYIVLGALLANSLGLLGGSLHIAMHAFAKISLFFAAGAILVATHKTKVSELDGLGRQMPFTFGVFLIGTLSIIGLPIFGGMWSKWYLLLGSIDYSGPEFTRWALLGTLMLSSLLNIVYLAAIPVRGFFVSSDQKMAIKEAPLPCLIGMAVPALMCIVLFFYPQPFFNLAMAGG